MTPYYDDGQVTDDAMSERPDAVMRASEMMRRVEGHSHMVGYECFGCEDKTPTLRKLGVVHFLKGGAIQMVPYSDADEWPDGEVHNGVAAITVSTYGDYPSGAYIYVCGPDELAVSKSWDRTRDAWMSVHHAAWEDTDG